jgi:hypothetical protein
MLGCAADNAGFPGAPALSPPMAPASPNNASSAPAIASETALDMPTTSGSGDMAVPANPGGAVAAAPPSSRPLAPISGGTLLVTRDGRTAVAADPDRDQVAVVDLVGETLLGMVPLQAGDEPGRLVEDGAGRVHVLLRASAQLASIDIQARAVLMRRALCGLPQGIAYDEPADLLHVACADGHLVSLPASEGPVLRDVRVDIDLRDVIATGSGLLVTRFKRAELLELDDSGAVRSRRQPGPLRVTFGENLSETERRQTTRTFDAEVAWRTVVAPDGRVAMVHQRAQVEEVKLPERGPAGDVNRIPGDSPYGGVDCEGIVQSAVTYMDLPGSVNGPLIPNGTLPVDAAISRDGKWLAIAVAGGFQNTSKKSVGAVLMRMGALPGSATDADGGACVSFGTDGSRGGTYGAGQVLGVAFDAQGRLVMQTRDPNRIRLADLNGDCIGCEVYPVDVDLRLAPVRDRGHDLFHADAGGGIACATCHPGGGDDGRTWLFSRIGARRTQLFNMGIADTLPLHWDGEFNRFGELMAEVYVRRMGGAELTEPQLQAMSDWIETLRPNPRIRAAEDPMALRGKALFESVEVGCAECHNGPKLTNNKSEDVGTGGEFQVPSLLGVAYHQPFMHTGCAPTLRDRFDPDCGGRAHGKTEDLDATQIDDLVAYLESL